MYRRSLLALSGAKPIERFLRKRGMRLGVGRFVAGSTLEEAAAAARSLEESGMRVILDLLGEFVDDPQGARAEVEEIVTALRWLPRQMEGPAMSVKPTQLGLGIDFELALSNAREIAQCGKRSGVAICLDMESHEYVDGTLSLYRTLREEGLDNISTVLQSYLRRSQRDLAELLAWGSNHELRIVKGAYREPPEVAYQDKSKVDREFTALVYRLLEAGGKANIATHDERILRECEGYLLGSGFESDRYEFQMLYGVKPGLQRSLRDRGHPVRVYVPYGSDWYGYFSRRLAERPANLMFVLRGLFG